ncbi:hypothetical protein [Pseudoalteromonas xiamenensis]
MEHSLYKFGAKDPVAVVRVQMERLSVNTSFSSESEVKHFVKDENGKFSLIHSHESDSFDEKQKDESTVELVQKLARQLRKDTVHRIIDYLYGL